MNPLTTLQKRWKSQIRCEQCDWWSPTYTDDLKVLAEAKVYAWLDLHKQMHHPNTIKERTSA